MLPIQIITDPAEVEDFRLLFGDGLFKNEVVNIEGINFSDVVEAAAEQRVQAEMSVQTEKQNEREKVLAETQVIQAKAQTDSQRALANAKAIRAKLY